MKPVVLRKIIESVLGVSIPTIEMCIGRNEDIMRHEWNSLNPKTPTDERRFYAEGHGMLWNMLAHSGLNIDGTETWPGSHFNMVASGKMKGTCLDYGCGMGRYGLIFANLGWDVTLVDIEGHAFKLVRTWVGLQERDNVKMIGIPVEEEYADLNGEVFDVIINYELMEHVPDPVEMLCFLLDHLKPKGLMFLSQFFDNLSLGGKIEPLAPYHLKRNFEKYNEPKVWYGIVEEAGLKPIWYDENNVPKIFQKT